jgi:hypothetical protein
MIAESAAPNAQISFWGKTCDILPLKNGLAAGDQGSETQAVEQGRSLRFVKPSDRRS